MFTVFWTSVGAPRPGGPCCEAMWTRPSLQIVATSFDFASAGMALPGTCAEKPPMIGSS